MAQHASAAHAPRFRVRQRFNVGDGRPAVAAGLAENGGIHLPRRPRERRGEADPGEIRQQQQGRDRVVPVELRRGEDDEDQQQEDFRKGPCAQVPDEEQPAPERVCRELRDEQCQRSPCIAQAGTSPHEPRGDGHEQVQHGPDGAEQPARWRPGRSRKLGVESPGFRRRSSPGARSDKGQEQPSGEPDGLARGRSSAWRVCHRWTNGALSRAGTASRYWRRAAARCYE